MKLTDDDRSELLDQLLPPDGTTPVREEDVFRWIEMERTARQRRLRSASIAAVVLLFAVSAVALFPRNRTGGTIASTSAVGSHGDVPAAQTEAAAPMVEQVDDEALMRLLDDTPSALVEWPDGRRSLLVVVRQLEQ
jgi:hypothetical protein